MLTQPASAQAKEKTAIADFNTKLSTNIASFKSSNAGVSTSTHPEDLCQVDQLVL